MFKVQLDNRIVNPLRSSEVKLGDNFALERSKSDKKSEIFGVSGYLLGDVARFAAPLWPKYISKKGQNFRIWSMEGHQ